MITLHYFLQLILVYFGKSRHRQIELSELDLSGLNSTVLNNGLQMTNA
jgi:hypothetical protein